MARGPASRVAGIADRILQAYADIGMRVSYSYALRDQNRLVYEPDDDFVKPVLRLNLAGRARSRIEGRLRVAHRELGTGGPSFSCYRQASPHDQLDLLFPERGGPSRLDRAVFRLTP
jgi:hypothetical protein